MSRKNKKRKKRKRTRDKIKKGAISKKRFIAGVSSATILMAVMASFMLSTGTVMGQAGPTMGGFSVKFANISGQQGADLTPTIDGSSKCQQLQTTIPTAVVHGVGMEKTIKTPDITPGVDNVSIDIHQPSRNSTATLNNLTMNLNGLKTGELDFGSNNSSVDTGSQVTIGDTGNSSDPLGGFEINMSGSLGLNNGTAESQLVMFRGADLGDGLEIDLNLNEQNIQTNNSGGCQ